MSADTLKQLRELGATEIEVRPDGTLVAKFPPPSLPAGVDPRQAPIYGPGPTIFEPPTFIPSFRVVDGELFRVVDREPCAFDGLPPGAYGLVCNCPRCSPRCETLSIASIGEGVANGSFTYAPGSVGLGKASS